MRPSGPPSLPGTRPRTEWGFPLGTRCGSPVCPSPHHSLSSAPTRGGGLVGDLIGKPEFRHPACFTWSRDVLGPFQRVSLRTLHWICCHLCWASAFFSRLISYPKLHAQLCRATPMSLKTLCSVWLSLGLCVCCPLSLVCPSSERLKDSAWRELCRDPQVSLLGLYSFQTLPSTAFISPFCY